MTIEELELKAKEFDSKLKRHPMSSEDLQKVLCEFALYLNVHDFKNNKVVICPNCKGENEYFEYENEYKCAYTDCEFKWSK